jgi:3-oxoacyl-[acyl-carrier-protein] synthase III
MKDNPSMNGEGKSVPFFDQEHVQVETIPVGKGIPLGMERISHSEIGIGGVYGTWGERYDSANVRELVEQRFGKSLKKEEILDLTPLGFDERHIVADMTDEEHLEVEVAVGAKFLREAAHASGWEPEEVEGVLIGMTAPITEDYTERIAKEAGIPDSALKVSVHKACDGSMGALHLALNPLLTEKVSINTNIARKLFGKKILVGGIEGLSRFAYHTMDKFAFQLFGNGAGVIGVIPGKTIKFLVGKTHEAFDEKGVLAVTMNYPHSGQSLLEVTQQGENRIRVAGLMHEPGDGTPVAMAGPMGMVKLFVRTGVQVVRDVHESYQKMMKESGRTRKRIKVAIAHHANLKINTLKDKHLRRIGINLPIPWVVREFGNVSAASNMIAFLRNLPYLNVGDHVLFDGFGAGTYYDVLAVELGD